MLTPFKILLAVFVLFSMSIQAQRIDKSFRLKVSDNRNLQFTSYEYLLKDDSMKISGVSDYGKSRVVYIAKKLKSKQKKAIRNFLKDFPLDSLQKEYFDDYVNFGYISSDHFPRVIELEIRTGLKQHFSKASNAYVKSYARLIDFLNTLINDDVVKINYMETDFKKTF